jgi:hypothetical protein
MWTIPHISSAEFESSKRYDLARMARQRLAPPGLFSCAEGLQRSEFCTGTPLASTPEFREDFMNNVELLQKIAQEQREAANLVAGDLIKGFQSIAIAHSDFNKRSLKEAAAFFEKLTNVKSFESAVEVHSEYKKAAYESFLIESKKITEVYVDLVKNSFNPIERLVSKPPASV